MTRSSTARRAVLTGVLALSVATALVACSSNNSGSGSATTTSAASLASPAGSEATSAGSGSSASAMSSSAAASSQPAASSDTATGGGTTGGTLTIWDPYPQFDKGSDWVKLLDSCGTQAGVTVKRTAFDTTDLTTKTLLAAQQGAAPNVLIIDNPVVSTLADAGILNTTDQIGLSTDGIAPNILAAGQLDGKTYGVPIGANTLALYYNKSVLKDAGVDVSTIKDWASLTDALSKVKAAGKKGITFSAIGTEEGSFQFLPWFWGAGGEPYPARFRAGHRRAAAVD